MTLAEIVLDASVAVRGLLRDEGSAVEITDRVAGGAITAYAPDLIVAEVTNALRVAIDVERWPLPAARERLDSFLGWPLAIQSCGPLAAAALEGAAPRGISGYDSFYAALADELDIPLVTADRRLADAVPGSVLVS